MPPAVDPRFPFLRRINQVRPLPSLPQAISGLTRLFHSGQPTLPDITTGILRDPAAAFKVLRIIVDRRLVKSPTRQFSEGIERLGVDALRVLAETQRSHLDTDLFVDGREGALRNLWRHSVTCALIAERLARCMGTAVPTEAYLAGLLHDVGKSLIWVTHARAYDTLMAHTPDGLQLLTAEQAQFGTAHSDLAADLFLSWGLSSLFSDAIRYHHRPLHEVFDALPLVRQTAVAHTLSEIDSGNGNWDELAAVLGSGIKPQVLEECVEASRWEIQAIFKALGMDSADTGAGYDEGAAAVPSLEAPPAINREHVAAGVFARMVTADRGPHPQEAILNCLQLVFDVRAVFFFFYDPLQHALVGKPSHGILRDRLLEQLCLPLRTDASLVARSFLDQKTYDSFGYLGEQSLAIADEQLIGLLGTEGMICLPMNYRSSPAGIILAGIDEAQFPVFSSQLDAIVQVASLGAALFSGMGIAHLSGAAPASVTLVSSGPALRKIVHEVNNPLGIIRTYLKLISGKFTEDAELQEEISIIEEEIDRVRQLIGQLASPGFDMGAAPIQHVGVDVNSALRNLSRVLERSILEPANIRIHFEMEPELPLFPGEKNSIIQIFINLIKNAVEAMPEGGNIYVHTALAEASSGATESSLAITIRDDGPGIPRAMGEAVFESGLSTKDTDHTGLGLSIVRDIVNRYGGNVSYSSRNGGGASIRIDLPFNGDDLSH